MVVNVRWFAESYAFLPTTTTTTKPFVPSIWGILHEPKENYAGSGTWISFLHSFLSSNMPSLRPLASISCCITSIYVFFGLPCALLTPSMPYLGYAFLPLYYFPASSKVHNTQLSMVKDIWVSCFGYFGIYNSVIFKVVQEYELLSTNWSCNVTVNA